MNPKKETTRSDPTQRFSSRVENYLKYRPRYPPAVIETLKAECQLTSAARVADIGSGTGMLAELFLQNGNHVFAVEPNREMREAGERLLQHNLNFHSIDGRAEATTLAEHSVDFVTAGQAFHWFDRTPTRAEFQRILKPEGWVMLVWNERDTTSTPFLRAYEQLLQDYATDYAQVNHKNVDEKILESFYGASGFKSKDFSNRQEFDYDGIQGRLLSSSYTPEAGHPQYAALLAELHKIFQAHHVNDRVAFEYVTTMYYGHLK
jgi:ubiquinone/menaquinone biosynthesis C-methylase UbiE